MSATITENDRSRSTPSVVRKQHDETKPSFLTTEFYAMVGVIVAVLVAAKVSDTFGDVRAWTLVAAVAIGYMISRGLAKSGSTHHIHSDDAR
jgi:dTDP-4-dehydrorhamnose 3,5-epimerase-like enzyme